MAKEPRGNRIPMMMSNEELSAIDDWRFANRIATRSDAIRRLCQIAIALEPMIAGGAMDQAEHLSGLITAHQHDYLDLKRQLRQGEFVETATPENILDQAIHDLFELGDNALWLQLQLVEAHDSIIDLSAKPPGASARDLRKTKKAIEARRDELIERRREGFDNMLLQMVKSAMTTSQRAYYDGLEEDAKDQLLNRRVAEARKIADELGIDEGTKLSDWPRGAPTPEFEALFSRVIDAISQ